MDKSLVECHEEVFLPDDNRVGIYHLTSDAYTYHFIFTAYVLDTHRYVLNIFVINFMTFIYIFNVLPVAYFMYLLLHS